MKGENAGFLRNLKTLFGSSLPEFIPVLDNFIGVVDLLTARGLKYRIDIASGRGFEYYTGMIFQLFDGDTKLGGGGRYDALIPLMGGKNIPASGFALLMNHLMEIIAIPPSNATEANKILIIISGGKPNVVKSAYNITDSLREADFIVSIQVDNEEKADFKWIIEVNDKSPEFTILNQSNKRKQTAQTIGDVIKLLGGKGGS
jgi:histidyl-tRNA synthetase